MPIFIEVAKIVLYTILWVVFVIVIYEGILRKSLVSMSILLLVWAIVNSVVMLLLSDTTWLLNLVISLAIAVGGFYFALVVISKPE